MSRLMTLMLTGDSAPENLRLLSSRKLDHLAAHGATPALRTAAAELAVLARTAADRAETDPTGWGRPESGTPLARLQAAVLYAILPAEEAWWHSRQDQPNPEYLRRCQERTAHQLELARTALGH